MAKIQKNIGTNTNCPDIIMMLTVIMYMYVFC